MNEKQHKSLAQLRKATEEIGVANAPLCVHETCDGVDVDIDVPVGSHHLIHVHLHIDEQGEVS